MKTSERKETMIFPCPCKRNQFQFDKYGTGFTVHNKRDWNKHPKQVTCTVCGVTKIC